MTKEVVTIHLGQAGVQMGNAIWELYCVEHGVTPEGKLLNLKEMNLNDRVETLFWESNGQYVPRSVFIDLEPTVIDEIRTGMYKHLFSPSAMISGNEDAANNYARGFYTIGKDKIDLIMDSVRKMVNNCDSISAFQIMHSYAGGTGSGLTNLLLLKLSETYGKKFRVSVGIFPSSTMSQSTVDPYNSLLHTHSAIEHIDCGILFDNESLYRKAINHLSCSRPTYSLMNRLISQMVTCVFLSHRYRYEGTHHIDVDELLTNLVPYPRIHFPVLSYAPIVGPDQIKHEKTDASELTRNVFQGDAHFLDCPFENNKYISCCLLYRGYISPRSVYDAVANVKCDRKITFVDWCPTGFKLGLNTIPPIGIPNLPLATASTCLCMVSGNVGIKEAWRRDRSKFDLIFNKRAFVHWFVGEGLEESEFLDSREDIITLENDYEEIAKDTEDAEKSTEEKRTSETKSKSIRSEHSPDEKQRKSASIKERPSKSSVSTLPVPGASIIRASKTSTSAVPPQGNSIISRKSKRASEISAPRKSSIMSKREESPVENVVQGAVETSLHSEVLDASGNAFLSNNYYSSEDSYKCSEDAEFGFEVEDPSWIDGSPSNEPRKNNKIPNSNNSQSAYNSGIDQRSFQIPRNGIAQSPQKLAKFSDNKPFSSDSKKNSKSEFIDRSRTNATRTPRTIKRSWWRKGATSSNNSYINSGTLAENYNNQIDNLFSKMDVELLEKTSANNSNLLQWTDSNPFTKSNQWGFSNVANLVTSTPENPFKHILNHNRNTAFSSSISSFVDNSLRSNNSSNVSQYSQFLPMTPVHQVNQINNFSFLPHYKSSDNNSNSDISSLLPPPPDQEELKKSLTMRREYLPLSQMFESSISSETKSIFSKKPNNPNNISQLRPTFSSFVPSVPQTKIPARIKIPIKSQTIPMNVSESCVIDATIHQLSKKRNLIISPIESLDCEATISKQPKLSLMNFILKKFQSSKSSNGQKKMSMSTSNNSMR